MKTLLFVFTCLLCIGVAAQDGEEEMKKLDNMDDVTDLDSAEVFGDVGPVQVTKPAAKPMILRSGDVTKGKPKWVAEKKLPFCHKAPVGNLKLCVPQDLGACFCLGKKK